MLWAKIMKLSRYVKQYYIDTSNKSARFSSNILGDTTLQSLKSEKTRKISLVPMPMHENLADLFLILSGQPQMALNFPEMRLQGPF